MGTAVQPGQETLVERAERLARQQRPRETLVERAARLAGASAPTPTAPPIETQAAAPSPRRILAPKTSKPLIPIPDSRPFDNVMTRPLDSPTAVSEQAKAARDSAELSSIPVTPSPQPVVVSAVTPRQPSPLDNPLTPPGPYAHDNAAAFERYPRGASATWGAEFPGGKILSAMRGEGAKLAQTRAQADSVLRAKLGPDLSERLQAIAEDKPVHQVVPANFMGDGRPAYTIEHPGHDVAVRAGAMLGSMAVGAIEHPIRTATDLVTAPINSADVLTRYAYQQAAQRLGVLDQWTLIGGEPVSGKEAAWAAAQLAAIGVAKPIERAIESRLASAILERHNAGLPTAGMTRAAAAVAHGVPGAAIGAAYAPDDPLAGGLVGGVLGGAHGYAGIQPPAKPSPTFEYDGRTMQTGEGLAAHPDNLLANPLRPSVEIRQPRTTTGRVRTEDLPPESTEPDYTVEMNKPPKKKIVRPANDVEKTESAPPAAQGTSKEPETLVGVASKSRATGDVVATNGFEGGHSALPGVPAAWQERQAGWVDGFITSTGRFVDREEGLRVARERDQLRRAGEPRMRGGGTYEGIGDRSKLEAGDIKPSDAERHPEQPPESPPAASDLSQDEVHKIAQVHELDDLAAQATKLGAEDGTRTVVDRYRQLIQDGATPDVAKQTIADEHLETAKKKGIAPEQIETLAQRAERVSAAATEETKPTPTASEAATSHPEEAAEPEAPKAVASDKPSVTESTNPETERETKHEFSSTQVNLPKETADKIKTFGASIPDEDLAPDGRESEPHITLKYGLHGDNVEAVRKALADEPPITATMGKTSIFPNGESNSGDVVKVDIDSPDLHRLNAKVAAAAPHTDTHPEYKPHATIAYVKPGLGAKYAGRSDLEGQKLTFDRVVFSDRNGNTTEIPLGGAAKKSEPKLKKPATPQVPPLEGMTPLGATPPKPSTRETATERNARYMRELTAEIAEIDSDPAKLHEGSAEGEKLRKRRATAVNQLSGFGGVAPEMPPEPTQPKAEVLERGQFTRGRTTFYFELRHTPAEGAHPEKWGVIAQTAFGRALQGRGKSTGTKGGQWFTDEQQARDLFNKWTGKEGRAGTPDSEASAQKPAPSEQASAAKLTKYDTPKVLEAREWNATHEPTFEIYKRSPSAERDALRQRIADALYHASVPARDKQFTFWIGLPASGKSGLAELEARRTGALILDTDDAKKRLPEYLDGKGTTVVHREGSLIRNLARERAIADGANIVIPTVGHDLEGLRGEIDVLAAAGWTVHLRLAELDANTAAERAVIRYESGGGIFVDPAYILSLDGVPSATYEALKTHPGVADYAKYDTDTPKGTPPKLLESSRGGRGDATAGAGGPGQPRLAGEPAGRAAASAADAHPTEEAEVANERPQLRGPRSVGPDASRVDGEERSGAVSGVEGGRGAREGGEERPGARRIRVPGNAEPTPRGGEGGEAVGEPTSASGAVPAAGGGDRRLKRPGAEPRVGETAAGGVHEREHGDVERGAASAESPERNPADTGIPARDLADRGSNYRLTDADEIGGGSPKTKVRQNIEAIKLVAKLRAEGRMRATPEEQAVLAKYVGWGAFPKYFERYSAEAASPEGKALRELLTDVEFERARSSTKNAHYTSPEIVRGMWDAMRRLGFTRGRALEPSMGSGNFVGFAPADMKIGWTGIEKDELTGHIASFLYPESDIHVAGYEDVVLRNGSHDVAISNVPFGKIKLYDPNYKHLRNFSIHDFFFAKTLDKVRPGGIVAFITSRYTMDKGSDAVRKYISDRADLLGAIRLPFTAFKGNAGTEVVTDILFLKVREKGTPASGETWRDRGTVTLRTPYGQEVEKSINEYYIRHPEMMLGTLSLERSMFSDQDLVLRPHEQGTLAEHLAAAVAKLPEGVYERATRPVKGAQQMPVVNAPDNTQPGTYLVHDGKLMQVGIDRTMAPAPIAKGQEKKVRQLVELRDQARKVIRANTAPDATDEDIERERKVLEKQYKAFVKAHGPINLEKRSEGVNKNGIAWRRVSYPNRDMISDDPGLATLLALEKYDEATDKAAPADLITKGRIIPKPKSIESVDTGFDAIAASLGKFGRLDLDEMAKLRGVDVESLKEELKGEIYEDPDTGEWEIKAKYLSGNVKNKLAVAERAAKQDPKYQPNVDALRAAAPPDVPPASISVRFGVRWVKNREYSQFIAELLGVPDRAGDIAVSKDEATGAWKIEAPSLEHSVANTSTHGTPKMTAIEIIQRSMNSQPMRVTSTINLGELGKRTVPDKEQTALVAAKQRELAAKFRSWLFTENAERGEKMLRRFNDDHNNTVPPKYDGKMLTVPGIATHINGVKFEWFEHQKNALMRFIQNGNILLAHAPGAGKTYTFVAMGMEARRLGFAKRPMIAVPNHMLAQATREAQQLYPGARILALGTDDTSSKAKQLLAARAASNEWDLIITTHMGMSRIPMSKQFQAEFLRERLNELREILEAEQAKGGLRSRNRPQRGKSRTVKQMEATIEDYEGRVKALMDAPSDDSMTFEELGVDLLIVDEAHEFKNLNFATRVEGIQVGNNKAATQLHMKTKYLHQINPTHGIVFATGTPVTNSIAELWTMQRYVHPKGLVESGLERFDDWQTVFGSIVTRMEKNTVGNYEVKSRLAKYVNVPSMIQRFREFADVKTIAELGLPRPPLIGGSFTPIVAPEPKGMKAYLAMLKEQWDALKKMKPEEARASGISFLSLGNQAKMAGLDMRLVDAAYTDEDGPFKVDMAADQIHQLYEEHAAHKGVQVVFLDASVDKGEDAVSKLGGRRGFNLYAELKRQLIAKGVPAKEIAFTQDANTEAKKAILKRKMNDGELRVVIASTQQLGVGANIQKRLVALHRLDVPWRPDQIEQSEARILRMGNELYEPKDKDGNKLPPIIEGVRIFRYVTEGSYDQYMWDTVLRKAKFVAQAMSGDASIAELDEMADEAAQGAQLMAAMASNNPLELERADLAQKVAELQAEAAGHRQAQAGVVAEIRHLRDQISILEKEEKAARKDAEKKEDTTGDKFRIVIGGETYTKRADAKEALEKFLAAIPKGEAKVVGRLGGFQIEAKAEARGVSLGIVANRPAITYVPNGSESGALQSLEYRLREVGATENFPKHIAKHEQTIRELQQNVGREFPRTAELEQAEARLREVEGELLKQGTPTAAADANEDYLDGPSEPKKPGEGTQLYGFADPFTAAAAMLYRTKPVQATLGVAVDKLKQVDYAIRAIFNATSLAPGAGRIGRIIRANRAEFDREIARAHEAIDQVRGALDKLDPGALYDGPRWQWYMEAENGRPAGSPELDRLYEVLRNLQDGVADEIRALGPGHLDSVNENYMARVYVPLSGARKQRAMNLYGAKRPMAGPKGFKKQRKHETLEESIQAALAIGMGPPTDNPLDMVLLKVREMRRYLMAQRIFLEGRGRTKQSRVKLIRFVKASTPVPEGWAKINDSMATVFAPRGQEGETRIRGYYIAPIDVARIVNNFLSPGLRGNPIYDAYSWTGNLLNMVQLGMSAFHAGFVAFDATVQMAQLGLDEVLRGVSERTTTTTPLRKNATVSTTSWTPNRKLIVSGASKLGIAAASAATGPFTILPLPAALLQYWKGREMWHAYLSDATSTQVKVAIEGLVQGGGRAKMDDFYRSGNVQQFLAAFRDKRWAAAGLQAPFAAIEGMMYPLLEHVVPRMKLGAIYYAMPNELRKLPPKPSLDEVRDAAARVVDAVDARLGQMIYDNLFWHRVTKELLMAGIRSVGWNVGTLDVTAGAGVQLGGNLLKLGRGEARLFPPPKGERATGDEIHWQKVQYLAALAAVVALYGAIYTYLHTGEAPRDWKDFYFPRTGEKDPQGNEERIQPATYMKDITSVSQHGPSVLLHKTHPLVDYAADVIQNRDFLGDMIHDEEAGFWTQRNQDLKYLVHDVLKPFTFRNLEELNKRNAGTREKVEGFFGNQAAPREMVRTPAQNLMLRYLRGKGGGAMTPDQRAASDMRSDLKRQLRRGDKTLADVRAMVQSGELSPGQGTNAARAGRLDPRVTQYMQLSAEQAVKVYELANEDEKALWNRIYQARKRQVDRLDQRKQIRRPSPTP